MEICPISKLQPAARKVSAKMKTRIPKTDPKILAATTMAMLMPATSFLNKTNELKLEDRYEKIGDQWYRIHTPVDASDYPSQTPCDNPYKQPSYVPYS